MYLTIYIHVYIYIGVFLAYIDSFHFTFIFKANKLLCTRLATLRLLRRVGFRGHTNRAPGKHLGFEHPHMNAVRLFVAEACDKHSVHPQMICNFDQVWTQLYEHKTKTWFKGKEKENKYPSSVKPSMQKIASSIRAALHLETTTGEDVEDKKSNRYKVKHVELNAQANVSPIDNWRYPRTTTTISWCDGDLSSAFITVKSGTAPEKTIDDLNRQLKGSIYIHCNDSKTHMWSSTTMLYFLEHLAIQIRERRMKLNLKVSESRALILMDKAAVHACTTFHNIRMRFQEEHNVLLVHGSSGDLVRVPPGWGAAGSPNDGFHQYYHLLRKAFQHLAVGQGCKLAHRRALAELPLAVDGNVRFSFLGWFLVYI